MKKFLAVVKREYIQRVRTKMFIFATILGPLVISLFGIVPALIFNIKAGEPVSIAIVDETGRLYQRVHDSILNDVSELEEEVSTSDSARGIKPEPEAQPDQIPSAGFELEQIPLNGRSTEEIKAELNERVRANDLDGYLILIILGAVIEEKETRIAEILFSSLKPFTLMIGKIVGISLVALTQFGVWGLAFIVFVVLGARELSINIPDIAPMVYVYFGLFFLLGYFIYATIYALIGSMVTTAQEGGQLAMPIILLLVIGFYFAFPVIQSPDSSMAFWASMVPFFSPITMLVRIVALTPPFWQIALSLIIGVATVLLLLWVAARIYRTGMLMYGKRASIPEAWRWVRES